MTRSRAGRLRQGRAGDYVLAQRPDAANGSLAVAALEDKIISARHGRRAERESPRKTSSASTKVPAGTGGAPTTSTPCQRRRARKVNFIVDADVAGSSSR